MYLDQKLNKEHKEHLSAEDLQEILPQILDIMKQNEERDAFDHENFLSSNVTKLFKQGNLDVSSQLKRFQKKATIWKPGKFKLDHDVFTQKDI